MNVLSGCGSEAHKMIQDIASIFNPKFKVGE